MICEKYPYKKYKKRGGYSILLGDQNIKSGFGFSVPLGLRVLKFNRYP